jgi:hypothetical protein
MVQIGLAAAAVRAEVWVSPRTRRRIHASRNPSRVPPASFRDRLRVFAVAGGLVRGGRRLRLRLAATWPWATQITTAITRLQALAPG